MRGTHGRTRRTSGRHRESALDLDTSEVARQITSFLRRAETGRLDAVRIARLYGMSLRDLSTLLRTSTAAIRRASDRQEYQHVLKRFEKAARILPLVRDVGAFAAWAKLPNPELNGASPIEALHDERGARLLQEVVEEVLVGQPD